MASKEEEASGITIPFGFSELILFSACDLGFYELFGPALRKSAVAHGHEILIWHTGEYVRSKGDRIKHSVMRYMWLPDVLTKHESVLVLDTDSLINKHIEIGDVDIGLFVKDSKNEKTRVNGSCVYFHKRALPAALALRESLSGPLEWYDDQLALYRLYCRGEWRVERFGPDFLSWDFDPQACVWTGKGEIKLSDRWHEAMKRYEPESFKPIRGVA